MNISAGVIGGFLLAVILAVLLSEFKGTNKKEHQSTVKSEHIHNKPVFHVHTPHQNGRINHEETVSYRVLDHNTFPENQNITSESEDTITMQQKKHQ